MSADRISAVASDAASLLLRHPRHGVNGGVQPLSPAVCVVAEAPAVHAPAGRSITIALKLLLPALKRVAKCAAKYPVVLGSVRLSALGVDHAELIATDLDVSLRCVVAADVQHDAGFAVLLPPALVKPLLARKGAGAVTFTSASETSVTATVDGQAFTAATIAVAQFPCVDYARGEVVLTVDSGEFLASASACITVASVDDTRPNLRGASVEFDHDLACARFAATDGHRLYLGPYLGSTLTTEGGEAPAVGKSTPVILPTWALRVAIAGLTGRGAASGEVVILESGASHRVIVLPDGSEVCARVIDGVFPDFRCVIPRGAGTCAVLSGEVAPMIEALKSVLPFTAERSHGVKFRVNGTLRIEARDVDKGETAIEAPCAVLHVSGNEEDTVCFNAAYLLDALKSHASSRFEMHLHGAIVPARDGRATGYQVNGPGVLRDNNGAIHVVMPMRMG